MNRDQKKWLKDQLDVAEREARSVIWRKHEEEAKKVPAAVVKARALIKEYDVKQAAKQEAERKLMYAASSRLQELFLFASPEDARAALEQFRKDWCK